MDLKPLNRFTRIKRPYNVRKVRQSNSTEISSHDTWAGCSESGSSDGSFGSWAPVLNGWQRCQGRDWNKNILGSGGVRNAYELAALFSTGNSIESLF